MPSLLTSSRRVFLDFLAPLPSADTVRRDPLDYDIVTNEYHRGRLPSRMTAIWNADRSTMRVAWAKARQLAGVAILCTAMLLTQSALGQSVLPIRRSLALRKSTWKTRTHSSHGSPLLLPLTGGSSLPAQVASAISLDTRPSSSSVTPSSASGLSLPVFSHYTARTSSLTSVRAMQGLGCAVLAQLARHPRTCLCTGHLCKAS